MNHVSEIYNTYFNNIKIFQIEDGDVDPEWTLLYYLRNKCILYIVC